MILVKSNNIKKDTFEARLYKGLYGMNTGHLFTFHFFLWTPSGISPAGTSRPLPCKSREPVIYIILVFLAACGDWLWIKPAGCQLSIGVKGVRAFWSMAQLRQMAWTIVQTKQRLKSKWCEHEVQSSAILTQRPEIKSYTDYSSAEMIIEHIRINRKTFDMVVSHI